MTADYIAIVHVPPLVSLALALLTIGALLMAAFEARRRP